MEVAESKPAAAPKRKAQSQPSSSQGDGKRQRVKPASVKPASGSKRDDAINVDDDAPPAGTQKAAVKTAKGPNPPVLKNLETVNRRVEFSGTPDSGAKPRGGSSKPLIQSRLSTSSGSHPASSPVTLTALDPEWRSQFPSDVFFIPGPEDSTGDPTVKRQAGRKDYGTAYLAESLRLMNSHCGGGKPPDPLDDFETTEQAKVLAVWAEKLTQIREHLASERSAKAKAAAAAEAKAAAAAEAKAKAAEDKAKAAEAKAAASKPTAAAAPKPAAASQKAKSSVVDPLPPPPIPQLYHTGGGDEVLKMFAGFQDQIQWQSEVLDRYDYAGAP